MSRAYRFKPFLGEIWKNSPIDTKHKILFEKMHIWALFSLERFIESEVFEPA